MTVIVAPTAVAPPRWAVRAAHAVPLCVLPSTLWRIGLWLSLLPQMHRIGSYELDLAGYIAALSLVSEGLALLTLGLVRPWGEVFPRWFPGLGRRAVPARLAVGAATCGVVSLSLLCLWALLNQLFVNVHPDPSIDVSSELHATLPDSGPWLWLFLAAYLPLLAWPLLLAAVTLDYRRRAGVRNSPARYAG